MHWWIILEEFGPNIQHIAGVDNIFSDTLSILPSEPRNNRDPFTRKYQCRVNKLFALCRAENNENRFLLNLLIVQIEKQIELRNINSKLSTYISDLGSSYSMTFSSPRRPLFLHALSFECTSKLCINFLNRFSVYFHI